MKKICLLLLCLLLLWMAPSTALAVEPFWEVTEGVWRFVVDDAVTYQSADLPPIVENGKMYLPAPLILEPLGAAWGLEEMTRTLSIYRGEQIVAINLLTGQAITSDGRFLITRAFQHNGTFYVEADLAIREFGGRLTNLSDGTMRVASGSQTLTDAEMAALMASMPSYRPVMTDQPPVYLLMRGRGAGISRILEQLSACDLRAAFFVTAQDILTDPATVRRLYVAGHRIGIYAPDGAVATVERTNDLLQKLLKQRTTLVAAPSGATGTVVRAGYRVWSASFSTAQESEDLSITSLLATAGWTTSVWFDGSIASADCLARVFRAIPSQRLNTAAET
ncbi:MAG: hypothetical protein IJC43_02075, partial [Clostridia bacterium]|nr:hypothetical protein [Clostridia bacterium]